MTRKEIIERLENAFLKVLPMYKDCEELTVDEKQLINAVRATTLAAIGMLKPF